MITTTQDHPRLFDDVPDLERKVRTMDPETSYRAAAKITTVEHTSLKADLYQLLLEHGKQTHDDLYDLYRTQATTRGDTKVRTPQRVRTALAEMCVVYRGEQPSVRRLEEFGRSANGGDAHLWEAIP